MNSTAMLILNDMDNIIFEFVSIFMLKDETDNFEEFTRGYTDKDKKFAIFYTFLFGAFIFIFGI